MNSRDFPNKIINFFIRCMEIKINFVADFPNIVGIKISFFINCVSFRFSSNMNSFSHKKLITFRNQIGKITEAFFNRFSIAINIQMICINRSYCRPIWRKVQKTSIIFIGFNHRNFISIKQKIRFKILRNSTQKTRERQIRFFTQMRHQRGSCRFTVRSCNRDTIGVFSDHSKNFRSF